MLTIDKKFQENFSDLLEAIDNGNFEEAKESSQNKIWDYLRDNKIEELKYFILNIAHALLLQSPDIVELLWEEIEAKQLKKLDFNTLLDVMPEKRANLLAYLLTQAQRGVSVPKNFRENCEKKIIFNWYEPILQERDLYTRYDWQEKLDILPVNLAEELRKPENLTLFKQIINHAFHGSFWKDILIRFLKVRKEDFLLGNIDKFCLLGMVDLFPSWNETENVQQGFNWALIKFNSLLELGADVFLPEMGNMIIQKLIKEKQIIKNPQSFATLLALLIYYKLDINNPSLLKYMIDSDIELSLLKDVSNILLKLGADPDSLEDEHDDKDKLALILQLKTPGIESKSVIEAAYAIETPSSSTDIFLIDAEEKLKLLISFLQDDNNDVLMNIPDGMLQSFYEMALSVESLDYRLKSQFEFDQAKLTRVEKLNKNFKEFSETIAAGKIVKASKKNHFKMTEDKLEHLTLTSSGHAIVIFSNESLASKINETNFLFIAGAHQGKGYQENVSKKLNSLINKEILHRFREKLRKIETYGDLFAYALECRGLDDETTNIMQQEVGEEVFYRMKQQRTGLRGLDKFQDFVVFYERKIYQDPTMLTAFMYDGGGPTINLISEEAKANNNLCQKLKAAYNFAVIDQLDIEISKKFDAAAQAKSKTPWKLGWFGHSTTTVTFKEAVYDVPNTVYQLVELLNGYKTIDRESMEGKDEQDAVSLYAEQINNLLTTSKNDVLKKLGEWFKALIGCGRQTETTNFYKDMNQVTAKRYGCGPS